MSVTAVQVAVEHLRLLHIRSEHGYTEVSVDAMQDEPEAVSVAYQRQLIRQAERLLEARQRRAWTESRGRIEEELERLGGLHLGVDVANDLRTLQHGLDRLDRRLRSALAR